MNKQKYLIFEYLYFCGCAKHPHAKLRLQSFINKKIPMSERSSSKEDCERKLFSYWSSNSDTFMDSKEDMSKEACKGQLVLLLEDIKKQIKHVNRGSLYE